MNLFKSSKRTPDFLCNHEGTTTSESVLMTVNYCMNAAFDHDRFILIHNAFLKIYILKHFCDVLINLLGNILPILIKKYIFTICAL